MAPDPGGWPWPLNGVQGWFESLWDAITGVASSVISGLVKWFSWVRDQVASALNTAVSTIGSTLSSVVAAAQTALGSAISGVTTFLGSVKDTLWGGIQGLGSYLAKVWAGIENAVGNAVTGITNFIGNIGKALGDALSGLAKGVVDALSGLAKSIGEAVMGAFKWIWENLTAALGAVAGFLQANVVEPFMGALAWIRDRIVDILKSLWTTFIGLFKGHSPITPEEAAVLTIPILVISAGAGFGVSVLGAVGSLKALGTGIEARAMTDFLESAFGLADFTRAVLTPVLHAAYQIPITYHWNALFRPTIPSTGQADQMLFEAHIEADEWRQIYKWHGWKDAHIEAWFKTMFLEPSDRLLISMVEEPTVPIEWIRQKVLERGYAPADAEVLVNYAQARALERAKEVRETVVITRLKEGYITLENFEAELMALDYRPDQISKIRAGALLAVDTEVRKEEVNLLIMAFRKDIITADELAAGLATYIVDHDRIENLVLLEEWRKVPKPKPAAL